VQATPAHAAAPAGESLAAAMASVTLSSSSSRGTLAAAPVQQAPVLAAPSRRCLTHLTVKGDWSEQVEQS
jgi:hypothetical protein